MASDTAPFPVATVSLQLLDGAPDFVATEAQDILKAAGMELRVVRQTPKPHAGPELYQPTAAILLVTADLFHDVLAKAGEDTYVALTQATSAIWRQAPSATQTKYSRAFSIIGQYAPGLNFKLLFKADIPADEAQAGIASFLHLIDDLLSDRVSEADCTALLAYLPVGSIVLVTYDAVAGKIVPINAGADASSER